MVRWQAVVLLHPPRARAAVTRLLGGTPRVEAELNYLRDASRRPRADALDPTRRFLPLEPRRVRIQDLRGARHQPSLDEEGFTLIRHRSDVDLDDLEAIDREYRDELASVGRELTGSPHVYVAPRAILRSNDHRMSSSGGVVVDGIAPVVHGDCPHATAVAEARSALHHHGIESMPEGRVVVLTLWRSLAPPPQDAPLAVCDLRTVSDEHLVPADVTGNVGASDLHSEFFLLLHDPRHRWYYFSGMERDDLLVIKQHDCGISGPSGCPHSAFKDPTCRRSAAPRVSLEARVFVFPDADAVAHRR